MAWSAHKNSTNNHANRNSGGSSTSTTSKNTACSLKTNDDQQQTTTTTTASVSSQATAVAVTAAMIVNGTGGHGYGHFGTTTTSSSDACAAGTVVVGVVHTAASVRNGRRPQIPPRTMLSHSRCSSANSKNGRINSNVSAFSAPVLQRLLMPTMLFLCMAHLPQIVHAAPTGGYSRTNTVHVPIGAVFTLDVGDFRADIPADGFPGWARLNDSANVVYGIPQANDVGVYTIPLRGGERNVQIEVGNELKQRCEEEMKTIWLEIVDQQRIDELSMESQFNSVKSLLAKLNVRMADMRLFPFNYLDTYRTVTEIMHELDQSQQHNHPTVQQKIHGQQIVYTVNISCGELNEQSSEVISAAIENGLSFQVVQGILVKLHEYEFTSPAPSDQQTDYGAKNGQKDAETSTSGSNASSPASAVPLIILALILAVLVLVGIFWILIKRAKAGQEKQTDANGKAHSGTAHLPSPAGDSTTPMLDMQGNADRTTTDAVGMAPENGTAGRN